MKKSIVLLSCLSLCAQYSIAAQIDFKPPGLINSEYMKEFNLFERQKQIPEILKTPNESKIFILKQVNFNDNSSFPSFELIKLVEDKVGKPTTPNDLNLIKKSITQFYQDKGYSSAVVSISTAEVDQGIIKISISEGNKNETKIEAEH